MGFVPHKHVARVETATLRIAPSRELKAQQKGKAGDERSNGAARAERENTSDSHLNKN